jgi:hypothetical protein
MGIGPAEAACGVPALVRRATARLMVLAMLLLSAAPLAWPGAAAAGHDGAGYAAAAGDCGSLDHAAGHGTAAGEEQAPRHGPHEDSLPGLGCCLGLLCPMLVAKLPSAVGQRIVLPGGRAASVPPAHPPVGLDVPPPLPPPRGAV